jgi:hypothetical protein
MLITRKSFLTGVERTLDLPITQLQIDAWENGMLVQEAFPNLSADDREFIMTGVISDEWDNAFKDVDDIS